MKHYFQLQKTIIDRHLVAWGVRPWLGYVLGIGLFLGLCLLAYSRTGFAGYGILAVGGWLLGWLSGRERNDFLAITFDRAAYRKIRLLENSIVCLPFLVVLLAKGDWALALVQGGVGIAMSSLRLAPTSAFTIPTPFGAYPFEAAVGFRRFWWLVAVAVFLLVMGVRADNMQLAIFSYGGLMFLYLMFYSEPEPAFYVWIHADTPQQFLVRKLAVALGYQLLLAIPFLISIVFFFPEVGWSLLIGPVIAGLNLALILFIKYSVFPHPLNIVDSLALMTGLILWPFLLFLLPYYYFRALPVLAVQLPRLNSLDDNRPPKTS
ncbi:hypothetical protein FUA23_00720 [Neolewinella aurantiaca]|uniref:Uncharacterized protein n=1 Tax=Neolewinella aurantiaca TaxID=2602767 RepID=A0A5C7G1G8_9BACT|nr:hypothetical protein [Neolewinella aurantiaca]TXF91742.1 hypothetical protein FUA23_00720 [Neolewinella aurantiaca]